MFAQRGAGEDQSSAAEHEDKERKLRDITSYLVSAGYFRARDAALTPFDKVVGGMCWCITHAHTSLDVDVLFRGNTSNTGQDIRLAEQIVLCLRAMGCPAPLQAHQIQGCDWAQVHPVIAWLIKTMFQARADRAEPLRRQSELQFAKFYDVQELLKHCGHDAPQAAVFSPAPERRFRYAGDASALSSEESAVFACLLEFGERLDTKLSAAKGGKETAKEKDVEAAIKAAEHAAAETRAAEALAAAALQREMADASVRGTVAGASVGAMVRQHASEIAAAKLLYEARGGGASTAQLQEDAAISAEVRRRGVVAREKTAEKAAEALALAAEASALSEAAESVRLEGVEARAFNSRVEAEIAKLIALEARCDASKLKDLHELKRLVSANEALKRDEAEFRSDCKVKMAELKLQLADSEASAADAERLAEIESMHQKVVAKDAKVRRLLAAAARRVSATARLIDDVPTRTELVQYERRFLELYAQVATKLDETRKYYELHNSLDAILKLHQREVSILNSIIDSFQGAMQTKQSKATFLAQLDDINVGLAKTLAAKRDGLAKAAARAATLQAQLQALVEGHRTYHAAVKEFHDECQKNETLSQRIASHCGQALK
ncbi:coiled-coil domain-containing protein-domain containing protein [Pelagophyceae sp. CCMP2097]|nr:coiled-coil domain-containing protein-domain containing protein [Pelagophyceae sp. CCMP2097]|mmetsp:Transcript_9233/g.32401  ORF Transcript_9233/g.32401 Transcript_9233/m.32401 type:complete len:609 (+) Transcript_9233:96-1922(+)